MNTKICGCCKIVKNNDEFYIDKSKKSGLTSFCKECSSIRKKTSYYKNLGLSRESNRIARKRQRDNDRISVNIKRREYYKLKMENDPLFKLKKNIRNRIRSYTKFGYKSQKTFEIVGLTAENLKIYIENKFTNEMSWENYGPYGWHIDHIIPLDSATTQEELYKLCNYNNLQPLWWSENLKKSSKIGI